MKRQKILKTKKSLSQYPRVKVGKFECLVCFSSQFFYYILLSQTKKTCKYSHLRSWSQWIFAVYKKTTEMIIENYCGFIFCRLVAVLSPLVLCITIEHYLRKKKTLDCLGYLNKN